MNRNLKLAIDGGEPVRSKEFKSLPYLDDDVIERVSKLLSEKKLSKFVGSSIPGTNEILGLSSLEVNKIKDEVTFLGGKRVRKMEHLWSKQHDVKYSVSVNSATSGLLAAILAADIKPDEEIICTPFSFTSTSAAIVQANAVPIFADIDLDTFNLTADGLEEKVNKTSKAIMTVHWNGNPGEFDELISFAKNRELKLIEDASQSPGIIYKDKFLGTHGDVGVFSLNEPKNIMTGEGGVVVTNDTDIAKKLRLLRNHGEAIVDESYSDSISKNIVGYNFRLTEIMAEIGIQQINNLDFLNKIRRENYFYLIDNLSSVCGEFLIPQKITNINHYCPYHAGFRWLSKKSNIHRDLIRYILRSEGIPVSQGMPKLMSSNPLFEKSYLLSIINSKRSSYKIGNLPNANELFNNQYLGFTQLGWPNTLDDMNDIIIAFEKIMSNKLLLENYEYKDDYKFISGR